MKGVGGALSIDGNHANVSMYNTTVRYNSAIKGGGLYLDKSSSSLIETSNIWGNNATDEGGGFHMDGTSDLKVLFTNICDNDAGTDGGGGYLGGSLSTLFVQGTAFLRNTAVNGYGGAICATHTKKPKSLNEIEQAKKAAATATTDTTETTETSATSATTKATTSATSKDFDRCFFVDSSLFSYNVAGQGGSIYWTFTNFDDTSIFSCGGNETEKIKTNKKCILRDNYPGGKDGLATNTVHTTLGSWIPPESVKTVVDMASGNMGGVNADGQYLDTSTTRSGVKLSAISSSGSPTIIAQDFYYQRSTLDFTTQCDLRTLVLNQLTTEQKNSFPLVRENAIVDNGAEITSDSGLIEFKNVAVRADIGASYYFVFQCTSGLSDIPVNLTVVPCHMARGLTEDRRCELCQAGKYSHTGTLCLPCPEGGNCTKKYPVIGKNNELTNISRGVELPSTLNGWWNELAPKSKRVGGGNAEYTPAKKLNGLLDCDKYGENCREKYCYWKQGICNPGEEEFTTEPTAEHPTGKIECKQLTDIEPERLYQCLTGRHMYFCPSGHKACPKTEFNGCLGKDSELWRALNITYDEEPEDPFKSYYSVAEGYECADTEELIVMEKMLDISEELNIGLANFTLTSFKNAKGVEVIVPENIVLRKREIYNTKGPQGVHDGKIMYKFYSTTINEEGVEDEESESFAVDGVEGVTPPILPIRALLPYSAVLHKCAQACAAQDDVFNLIDEEDDTAGSTNTTRRRRRMERKEKELFQSRRQLNKDDEWVGAAPDNPCWKRRNHMDSETNEPLDPPPDNLCNQDRYCKWEAETKVCIDMSEEEGRGPQTVVVAKKTIVHYPRPCTHFAFSYDKKRPNASLCYWPGKPMECKNLIPTPKPDDEMKRTYDSYKLNLDPVVRSILYDPYGMFYELEEDRGQSGMHGADLVDVKLNKSIGLPSGGNVFYIYDHFYNTNGASNMTWNGTVWDTSTPQTCIRKCGSGYGGAKCDTCLPGYFRSSLNECISCAAFGDRATSKKMFAYIGIGMFFCTIFGLWGYLASNPNGTIDLCLGCRCFHSDKALKMLQLKIDQKELLRRRHGRGSSRLSSEDDANNDNPHEHHNLSFRSEKFKIMLTFIQIFSQFKKNYGIRWPYLTSTYMRWLSGFNLDIIRILPIDCLYRTNYYTVLLMTIFMPVMVLVVCIAVSAMGRLYYRYHILSMPRKCVKTGRLIRGWMPKQHFEQTLIKIAKNILLADDDVGNDSMESIRNKASELDEHYHQGIPPGVSYLSAIRHSKTRLVQKHDFDDMIQFNIKLLRKRVKERLHYNIFANKVWKILFWAILLGYPSVCMRVMRIYQCEEVGNDLLLVHDLGLKCSTMEWRAMTSGAFIATIMYVVGAPLMFWFLLHTARNHRVAYTWKNALPFEKRMKMLMVMAKADSQVMGLVWQDPHSLAAQKRLVCGYLKRRNMRMHRVQHRLGFLYYAYRDKRWWYECIELFRKFLLNGFVVVIKTGNSSQMMLGLTICFIYLMIVLTIKPHLASSDHALMVTTHVQLVVTLFCGLMLSEKMEYMSAFISNRREARVKEVLGLELLIVISHLGTCLFGMASILYERYFSPEMYDIEKRRKHLANLRKHVHAKVKRRWGGLQLKHGVKEKKGHGDNSLNGIAGFMAQQEEEDMIGHADEVEIVTPGASLMKQLRKKGMMKAGKRKGLFGLGEKGQRSKVAPMNGANVKKKGKGRKGKTGDLSMTEQLQALRDAQSVIGEESKAPLDFDWGDEDDDSDDSDSELSKQQDEEDKKHQLHSFKEVDEEEEEEDGAIFDLLSIDDVNVFKKHLDTRSVSIEKSFETLQQYVQKRSDTLKTEYNNNRYDADMGTPQLVSLFFVEILFVFVFFFFFFF